jgi:hypothetical protein
MAQPQTGGLSSNRTICLDRNVRRLHILAMTLADYLSKPGNTAVGLGRRLDVSHSTIVRWAAGRVPAERARAVSEVTGIALHELRPDLFDPPARAAEAA